MTRLPFGFHVCHLARFPPLIPSFSSNSYSELTGIITDSAYHFTSAATLILRCALEADNDETAQACVHSASALLNRLRQLKDEANWDLSDMCLDQTSDIVTRMSDGDYLEFRRRNPVQTRLSNYPSDNISVNTRSTGLSTRKLTQGAGEKEQTIQAGDVSREGEAIDANGGTTFPPEMGEIGDQEMTSSDFYNPITFDQGFPIDPEYPLVQDLWQFPHSS